VNDTGLHFEVISLFPEFIEAGARVGVLGKACDKGLVSVNARQLRDFSGGSIHTVDDSPYGGGPGMVMRPEPIFAAVEEAQERIPKLHKILLTPQGQPFDQARARGLAERGQPILLFCSRYEGLDERARSLFDEELSIGDYILTGGELGALIIVDATARLLPGVLGSSLSAQEESFSQPDRLEYPHYTRPAEFRGQGVPPVLTSGNHAAIRKWREEQATERTQQRRPDLLAPSSASSKEGR
jgi:tRNA (guanine37-N1)-methyltransferase